MTVLQSTNPEYIIVPDGQGSALTLAAARTAEAAAALAEGANGPVYNSTALGIAATTEGQNFAVAGAGGVVSIYRNVAGVAVFQRDLVNTAALAAPTGDTLIGVEGGGTLRQKLASLYVHYPTIAAMKASILPGTLGAIWSAGGYTYRQVAASATDYDLITAGGVKLYINEIGNLIYLEAFDVDKTNTLDQTAILVQAGVAARRAKSGIGCSEGAIKYSGAVDIDWLSVDKIDCSCEFIRIGGSTCEIVLGGNPAATAHKVWNLSAYDVSDGFGITRAIPAVVRIQGAKHFDLQGRISKVRCFADGNLAGAESSGYGKINAEVYTLEIQSVNNGWFNHVHVYSQRIIKLLNYRSDGIYPTNGWTIEGLFELANAEIDLDHINDVYIRARFETPPAGFIKLRDNTSNILVENTNSNGKIQIWYQDWVKVWVGQNTGLNNRFVHLGQTGMDSALIARFDSRFAVTDGTSVSCEAIGWARPAAALRPDGVRFTTNGQIVLQGPWVKAKKGDVFVCNSESAGGVNWAQFAVEIVRVSDGLVPAADPDIMTHAFAKGSNWTYSTSGFLIGSYYTIAATSNWDAYMYTGDDDAYLVRPLIRSIVTGLNLNINSAAIWWSGRGLNSRAVDLLKVVEAPAILTAAITTAAPVGTRVYDGTSLKTSIRFHETHSTTARVAGANSVNFAHPMLGGANGDIIMLELDDGTWHITTASSVPATSSFITAVLPSAMGAGKRIRLGKWA